jgi:lipopolysaccharide/colanic/teichoic acid biosynthesis glycosyltransferase
MNFVPPSEPESETSAILREISLDSFPVWPSEAYRRWHWTKRVFDVSISVVGLVLLWPFFILGAILVKLSSPGPVFFRQERLSMHERPFVLIKFRTMCDQAEVKTGPTWVQENDNRITPLGHFLRKTHIDELPQLWNILMGDMSLIGPRPERPVFVKQFRDDKIAAYTCRHFFRPGITGYAQMENPNPTIDQIQDKTDDDLWYVTNWTPWVDCCLLSRTATYFFKSLFRQMGLASAKHD